MSSVFGDKLKISIFGESHGEAIGVVLDGLPCGEKIDIDKITEQMKRRCPGNDETATSRKESDAPKILSGLLNGFTTGAPLAAIIENNNKQSSDYENVKINPRPGHADYTASVKYNGFNDIRGGGHFSGRLTACIVFAGAICRQILYKKGVKIAAHIYSVSDIYDSKFDPIGVDETLINRLNRSGFALIDVEKEALIREKIISAKLNNDSVGGIVECIATGVPAGVGSPIFNGIESKISSIMFGIPAVKGIEFGIGFECSKMSGSQNNDEFYYDGNSIKTKTNNCGGILGGISNGMPIIFRVAIKPTPSIGIRQQSINLNSKENSEFVIKGRHDPCIVPRAVPVVESACAISLLDMMLKDNI